MRWLRLRQTPVSWLALLALAMQFTLSFGHVHLHGGQRFALAPLVLRSALKPTTPSQYTPADPAPDKSGLPGDFCSVCSVLQVVGSTVPPATPVLPLPATLGRIALAASPDVTSAASPHLLFQARAPPHA
jgi:hypothetical protein